MRRRAAAVMVAFAVGCSNGDADSSGPVSGFAMGGGAPMDASFDTSLIDTADIDSLEVEVEPDCAPVGVADCPLRIDSFPFVDTRSTADAPASAVDAYSCAPDNDESGPEWFYEVQVETRGILTVLVEDGDDDGVDIDVHLLSDVSPDSCLARDDTTTGWLVEPGTAIVVADTYVNNKGVVKSGEYTLTVNFLPLDEGRCAVVDTDVRMYWDECGPGIDCDVATHTNGVDYPFVHTPSIGPVVKEAHLVTTADDFGGGWPQSFTEQIAAHYRVSEAASGYKMKRTEPWAPHASGGSNFARGSTGEPIPPEHEAWYVNMYWRDRPEKGHRMILINPATGAAVVAAAGYETGPGSHTAMGGASEEIHHALGTVHRSPILMSFAADQTLPYGPINCF